MLVINLQTFVYQRYHEVKLTRCGKIANIALSVIVLVVSTPRSTFNFNLIFSKLKKKGKPIPIIDGENIRGSS